MRGDVFNWVFGTAAWLSSFVGTVLWEVVKQCTDELFFVQMASVRNSRWPDWGTRVTPQRLLGSFARLIANLWDPALGGLFAIHDVTISEALPAPLFLLDDNKSRVIRAENAKEPGHTVNTEKI